MSEPKQTSPTPSTLPQTQSSELRLLAAELDKTTRALLRVEQERDQALAETAQAHESLRECERALAECEQSLRADELIELRPQLWIRPSSIRDVETWHKVNISVQAKDASGKPQWLMENGRCKMDAKPGFPPAMIPVMIEGPEWTQRLTINGDERLSTNTTPARVEKLLAQILPHLSSAKK